MIENNNKPNLFYFGLEPLKARYTYQLSTRWMPEAFNLQSDKIKIIHNKNANLQINTNF